MKADDIIHVIGLYEKEEFESSFDEIYDEALDEMKYEYPDYIQEILFATEDNHVLIYITKNKEVVNSL